MKKIELALDKVWLFWDKLVYFFGGVGLLVAIFTYAFNIWDFWLFKRRFAWADDIALIGLVWASYVGLGLLFHINGHCTVDFIVNLLPSKAKLVATIIQDVLIAVTCIVAVKYSWILAIKSMNKVLTISKIPYFYVDIAITIGHGHLLLLTIAQCLRNIVKLLTREKEGNT